MWQVRSSLDSLCKILKTNTNSILFFSFPIQRFGISWKNTKLNTKWIIQCIRFGWLPSIIQIDPLRNFINLDRQLYRWENVFDQLKTKCGSTMYVWKINISLMLKCLEISIPELCILTKISIYTWFRKTRTKALIFTRGSVFFRKGSLLLFGLVLNFFCFQSNLESNHLRLVRC